MSDINLHIKKMLNTANGVMELNLEIDIKHGQRIAIYGASGAGKTTLLRCLAGLCNADSGHITVGDNVWFDSGRAINLPTRKRNVAMMFQEYALFPNMTVRQNLLYANSNAEQVDKMIELVKLNRLAARKPTMLSGGQQQRVALARVIVQQPDVLLLDEPLAALDRQMRTELQDEIIRLCDLMDITTILVSHDIGEIIRIANSVFCIDKGLLSRNGSPLDLFAGDKLSAKLQLIGELVAMQQSGIVVVASVLVNGQIIKVVATRQEASLLHLGQTVMLAAKAFSPVIIPI